MLNGSVKQIHKLFECGCQAFRKGRVMILAVGLLVMMSGIAIVHPAGAVETIAREAIIMDIDTGAVLFEKNADRPMAPASMSKLMTVYMLFERLKDGSLSLDDTFPVSENAWRRGGAKSGSSTMFLEPGSRVRVEDLIRGIIIQSGNDACIVVAEGLAGSEEAFAKEMTDRAREIGLTQSTFKNATGWPDPEHQMSPRDLAVLAKRLIDEFPEYYHYFSEKSFTYNNIRQANRNPLLYKDMGVDGLKTGHTKESGYGLTASAVRGERRLILVVNGLPSKKSRAREPERLLEWGFRDFNNYAMFKAGETVAQANVWLGKKATVPLIINNDLLITMPRKSRRKMKVTVNFSEPIPAPVRKGDEIARLRVSIPGRDTLEIPLLAGAGVGRLSLVGRLGAALQYILWGESG